MKVGENMAMMTVYHGGYMPVEKPQIRKGRNTTDFGTGFYCTIIKEQAEMCIRDRLYIEMANKPDTAGYYKAQKMLGLKKQEMLFVGDQLFTDILGANRCGFASILVKFIRIDETAPIGKRRHVENIILKFYQRSKKYKDRLGNLTVGREKDAAK